MVTRRLPSAGFSITIRVSVTADPSAIGRLTTAVGEAGGDRDRPGRGRLRPGPRGRRRHLRHRRRRPTPTRSTQALEDLDGVDVRKVSDRTFLLHLGGKIEVTPKVALRTATTCPAPTPRAWPGSAWRSRRTRTTPAG